MPLALLLPASVLLAHSLGYAGAGQLAAGSGAGGGHAHGYLPVAAALATPLAVLAMMSAVVAGRWSRRRMTMTAALGLQTGALLLQEAVEHALAGEPMGTLLMSEPLWLCLSAQLAVAVGAFLVLHGAHVVGGRLAGAAHGLELLVDAPQTATAAPSAGVPSSHPFLTLSPRAPPVPVR